MADALLKEIERDRNLMGGIRTRDKKLSKLDKRLKQLEEEAKEHQQIVASRDSKIDKLQRELNSALTELEMYRKILKPEGIARLLPVRLRGKDVPASLLTVKRQYWRIRNLHRNRGTE